MNNSTRFKYKCPKGHLHQSQKKADDCYYCKPEWRQQFQNKPGNSLHFKKIIDQHTKELIPVVPNIRDTWFVQQGLFIDDEQDYHLKNAHIKMGLFYELMVSAFCGGEVIDSIKEFDIGRKISNGEGIIPDVVSKENKQVFESKACLQGHHMLLSDDQTTKYREGLLLKEYETYYCFWRHGIKKIHSYRGSTESLFKNLGQWTFAGIILPFSIILNLWENKHGLCRQYKKTEKNWLVCTSVRSILLNNFIFDPVYMISRIGLDPLEYQFEILLSPKGFMIENIDVVQFPVIIIKDRDPRGWIQWFLNRVPF